MRLVIVNHKCFRPNVLWEDDLAPIERRLSQSKLNHTRLNPTTLNCANLRPTKLNNTEVNRFSGATIQDGSVHGMLAKAALEIQNGFLQNRFSGTAVQADSGHGGQSACRAKVATAKVTDPKQK